MSDFKLLRERGDTGQGSRPLIVYLYPNEPEDESTTEGPIKRGVRELAEQLMDGVIDYYAIYLYTGTLPKVADSGYFDHYKAFRRWYEGKYDHRVGVHLCVDADYSGGNASGGDGHGITAFSIARSAVVGTKLGGDNYARVTAAHEVLHPIINQELSDVQNLIESKEHNLGMVFNDNTVSPLGAWYGDQRTKGDCSTGLTQRDESTTMSNCTESAVTSTADDEFN